MSLYPVAHSSAKKGLQHEFPPFFETPIYQASRIFGDHLVHTSSRAYKTLSVRMHARYTIFTDISTFSNLPISSLISVLLGVDVSTEPSASTSGQRKSLCLPRFRVLYTDTVSSPKARHIKSSTHPFFPKSRNVEPPTGDAERGPSISHTVNVICEFSGSSQYRIGRVIHSFHLDKSQFLKLR